MEDGKIVEEPLIPGNVENININNNQQPSSDDVFKENKPTHLTFNSDSFNSSTTLGSPSRQQLIGNVINEVINDHINGDHPVPRMVLDEVDDEKTGVVVAHSIPSEKTLNGDGNFLNREILIENVPGNAKHENKDPANTALAETEDTVTIETKDDSTVGHLLNEIVERASNSVEPQMTSIEGSTLSKEGEFDNDNDKNTSIVTNDSQKYVEYGVVNDFVEENGTKEPIDTDIDENFTFVEFESVVPVESTSSGHHEGVQNLEASLEDRNYNKKESTNNSHTTVISSNDQVSNRTMLFNKDVTLLADKDIPNIDEKLESVINGSSSYSAKDDCDANDTSDTGTVTTAVIESTSENTKDESLINVDNTASKDTHEISKTEKPVDGKQGLGDDVDKKEDTFEEIGTEKTEECLDILGNSLLKKKVLREGLGRDSRPVQGDTVNIRFEGKLDDGTIVDTHNQLQMVLGDADVIQALDMCVALMEDKEMCTLSTDTRYAYSIYGRSDCNPPIPPNSDLIYELEILSVTRGKPLMEMTSEECISQSDKKRARGNDLYSRGDYAGAIDAYKRGLKYIEGRREKELLDMKVKCLNNLSAAQLKDRAYTMALQSLDVVLALEPENVKAIFRRGKCLEVLGEESDALDCMKKAALIDPDNKLIIQDLGRLKSRVAATQQKEKEIYRRMFQQKKTEAGIETEDVEKQQNDNSLLIYIGSAMVAAVGLIAGLVWYRHR